MKQDSSATTELASAVGARTWTDASAVDRNRSQRNRHEYKDRPRLRRHSAQNGDDQDSGYIDAVEPLAGSHERSFGTEFRNWKPGIRVKEE